MALHSDSLQLCICLILSIEHLAQHTLDNSVSIAMCGADCRDSLYKLFIAQSNKWSMFASGANAFSPVQSGVLGGLIRCNFYAVANLQLEPAKSQDWRPGPRGGTHRYILCALVCSYLPALGFRLSDSIVILGATDYIPKSLPTYFVLPAYVSRRRRSCCRLA